MLPKTERFHSILELLKTFIGVTKDGKEYKRQHRRQKMKAIPAREAIRAFMAA